MGEKTLDQIAEEAAEAVFPLKIPAHRAARQIYADAYKRGYSSGFVEACDQGSDGSGEYGIDAGRRIE